MYGLVECMISFLLFYMCFEYLLIFFK